MRPRALSDLARPGLALAAVALVSILATPAAAASCARSPSFRAVAVREALPDYDTVFIGTVTLVRPSVEYRGSLFTPVDFRVHWVLRGETVRRVTVMSDRGPAGAVDADGKAAVAFEEEARYGVVARRNGDGTLTTDACTPTGKLGRARAERLAGLAGADRPVAGSALWTGMARAEDSSGVLVAVAAVAGVAVLAGVAFLAVRVRRGWPGLDDLAA